MRVVVDRRATAIDLEPDCPSSGLNLASFSGVSVRQLQRYLVHHGNHLRPSHAGHSKQVLEIDRRLVKGNHCQWPSSWTENGCSVAYFLNQCNAPGNSLSFAALVTYETTPLVVTVASRPSGHEIFGIDTRCQSFRSPFLTLSFVLPALSEPFRHHALNGVDDDLGPRVPLRYSLGHQQQVD